MCTKFIGKGIWFYKVNRKSPKIREELENKFSSKIK